jgi:hypothetical protein
MRWQKNSASLEIDLSCMPTKRLSAEKVLSAYRHRGCLEVVEEGDLLGFHLFKFPLQQHVYNLGFNGKMSWIDNKTAHLIRDKPTKRILKHKMFWDPIE